MLKALICKMCIEFGSLSTTRSCIGGVVYECEIPVELLRN